MAAALASPTITNTARFAALEQEVLAARLTPVKRTQSSTPIKQRQQKPKIISPRFRPPIDSPGKRSRTFDSPDAREWPAWMRKVDEPLSAESAAPAAELVAASPAAPTVTLPPEALNRQPHTDSQRVNAVALAGVQRSKTSPRLRSQGSSRLPLGLPPRILSLATGRPAGVTPHRSMRSADEVASQIASGRMHLQHVSCRPLGPGQDAGTPKRLHAHADVSASPPFRVECFVVHAGPSPRRAARAARVPGSFSARDRSSPTPPPTVRRSAQISSRHEPPPRPSRVLLTRRTPFPRTSHNISSRRATREPRRGERGAGAAAGHAARVDGRALLARRPDAAARRQLRQREWRRCAGGRHRTGGRRRAGRRLRRRIGARAGWQLPEGALRPACSHLRRGSRGADASSSSRSPRLGRWQQQATDDRRRHPACRLAAAAWAVAEDVPRRGRSVREHELERGCGRQLAAITRSAAAGHRRSDDVSRAIVRTMSGGRGDRLHRHHRDHRRKRRRRHRCRSCHRRHRLHHLCGRRLPGRCFHRWPRRA